MGNTNERYKNYISPVLSFWLYPLTFAAKLKYGLFNKNFYGKYREN